ncbi:hypothetical protein FF011L_19750 [Roseimaritima multifibrata]|uniref:Uncharacterized protein n=1 Tax=Roseimaritima multifibrata TaxID=1930274 RepID=A0A517ME96_9BACT|nr:hypothetical protein [Roseimaritima multifibrata]QDS93214.1 hypothetical protein FF011L_19750 [Roseimaritima multifibrata]
MRTISYGIPILILGILAALPFRRTSTESVPIATPRSFDSGESTLREISTGNADLWSPDPEPPRADQPAPAAIPELPSDYNDVAIPMETPPEINDRFSATVPTPVRPPSAWASQRIAIPPATTVSEPAPELAKESSTAESSTAAPPAFRVSYPNATAARSRVSSETEQQRSALPPTPPQPGFGKESFQPAVEAAKPRKRYFIREPS